MMQDNGKTPLETACSRGQHTFNTSSGEHKQCVGCGQPSKMERMRRALNLVEKFWGDHAAWGDFATLNSAAKTRNVRISMFFSSSR